MPLKVKSSAEEGSFEKKLELPTALNECPLAPAGLFSSLPLVKDHQYSKLCGMRQIPAHEKAELKKLRQVRLSAPQRSSAEAYAQMLELRKAQLETLNSPEWNGSGRVPAKTDIFNP